MYNLTNSQYSFGVYGASSWVILGLLLESGYRFEGGGRVRFLGRSAVCNYFRGGYYRFFKEEKINFTLTVKGGSVELRVKGLQLH